VDSDDGAFFMEYKDFLKQFNYLYVCRIPPETFVSPSIRGEWSRKQGSCGGMHLNHTFVSNPQFHLGIIGTNNVAYGSDSVRVLISLRLENEPPAMDESESKQLNPVCLYVCKANVSSDGGTPKAVLNNSDLTVVAQSSCAKIFRGMVVGKCVYTMVINHTIFRLC
jgi:hypothetical protein